jgi:PAS domain-containing protein
MSPLNRSHDIPDVELTFAPTRPFDFHAWLATWQREYVFFRIDGRNRITFVAPSVKEILGFEPHELLGRDYRDFFDLEHPLQAQLSELTDRMAESDPPGLRRCVARRAWKEGLLHAPRAGNPRAIRPCRKGDDGPGHHGPSRGGAVAAAE